MLLLVVFAILLVNLTGAYHLVARLDYGAFQGAISVEYNVSYWQKIPYAAPPVGVNRCNSLGSFVPRLHNRAR